MLQQANTAYPPGGPYGRQPQLRSPRFHEGSGRHRTAACARRAGRCPPAQRKGEAGTDRLEHLAAALHFQEPHRLRPQPDRRGAEEEVWRDHHAGLPPVHQGHLPRRHPHGPVLRSVRRRRGRQHVRRGPADGGHRDPRHPRVRPVQRLRQASGWRSSPPRWPPTGTKCQHISNNAPRDICDPDAGKRKAGVEVAKRGVHRRLPDEKARRLPHGVGSRLPQRPRPRSRTPRPTASR